MHQLGLVLAGIVAGACVATLCISGSLPTATLARVNKDDPPNNLAKCEPYSGIKSTVCAMDHALVSLSTSWHDYALFEEAMAPYWLHNFSYLPMYGINPSTGLRNWFENEMETWSDAFPWVSFEQMLFLGSGPNASSTTYAVGTWEKALGMLNPTNKRMTVRITDFYRAADNGRIGTNWMIIDVLDLLRQQGKTPLPLSPLKQGKVSPPQGDGIPAPLMKFVTPAAATTARRVVSAMLEAEWVDGSDELLHWDEGFTWYGPVPFGLATGADDYTAHFLRPFQAAFAARTLDIDVFACEGEYCAAHGTFSGDHVGAWLGQPPSGRRLQLEFGMHWRVDMESAKIVEAWAIFDLPRMFLGLGIDLLAHDTPDATASTAADSLATAGISTATRAQLPFATDNECSNAYSRPPPGPTTLDCPAFVIYSTDQTWHARDWAKTSVAVDTYFSEDWQSVRAFGMMLRGREALRAFMIDWLGGFPDVFIHVADVFCEGNDEVGYKTTMPYVLTATHSGYSKAFGAPSGRAVKYHGIANCYIQRNAAGQWQYTREWDLPDMWSFVTALNTTGQLQMSHPSADLVPVDQCKPLFEWGSGEMNWFPPDDSPSARRTREM